MVDEKPAHTCPKCGADDVMRVPRTATWDYVMRWLGWRVYRCGACQAQFYDRPTSGVSRAVLAAPAVADLVSRLDQAAATLLPP